MGPGFWEGAVRFGLHARAEPYVLRLAYRGDDIEHIRSIPRVCF